MIPISSKPGFGTHQTDNSSSQQSTVSNTTPLGVIKLGEERETPKQVSQLNTPKTKSSSDAPPSLRSVSDTAFTGVENLRMRGGLVGKLLYVWGKISHAFAKLGTKTPTIEDHQPKPPKITHKNGDQARSESVTSAFQGISDAFKQFRKTISDCQLFKGGIFAPKGKNVQVTEDLETKKMRCMSQISDAVTLNFVQSLNKDVQSFISTQMAVLKDEGFSEKEAATIIKQTVDKTVTEVGQDYLESRQIQEVPTFSWVGEISSALDQYFVIENQVAILKDGASTKEQIQEAVKTIKEHVLSTLPPTASKDEQTKALAKELTAILAQLNPVSAFKEANREVSLELGKTILEPKNVAGEITENDPRQMAMKYIEAKGIENPYKCGEDFWRAMKGMQVFVPGKDTPEIDGSKTIQTGPKGDPQRNQEMYKTLDLFYQHVTGKPGAKLIEGGEHDQTQGHAGAVAKTVDTETAKRSEKSGTEKDTEVKTMQRMLGLGAQELFTRSGERAIPQDFRQGFANLQVAEFSGAYVARMEPFQYGREITVKLLENGGVEYSVSQPMTFKDSQSLEPLGFCRMVTTLVFDKEMNCLSQRQEVQGARDK